MLGTPSQNPTSQLNIADTPRTQASSQKNQLLSTPKKHKSPKTQLMEDMNMSLDTARLGTPIKDPRIKGTQILK